MEKSNIIEKLFYYIVIYSYLLLPVVFLLFKARKLDSWLFAIYGIIFFLLLFFGEKVPQKYFTLYYSVYTFLEYFFFSLFIFLNLQKKVLKIIIIGFSILFPFFQVLSHYFFDNTRTDSIAIGIESLLIFTYIFFYFYESLAFVKQDFIYSKYCFWVCVGALIYLGSSFFINILANTVSAEDFAKYWFFNYVADTIKTLFFCVAIIVLSKESKKTPNRSKKELLPYLDMS